MSKKDELEKRAVKTTIVGGQPPGNERPMPPIPIGIEELLGMAAVNRDFATALAADREAAIIASGVELTGTERGILSAIDDRTLAQMVVNVEGGVPNRARRAFLSRSAAALLVLAGGGAIASACGSDDKRQPKHRPDVAGGARPDIPEPPPQPADASVPIDAEAAALDPTGSGIGAGYGNRPDRPTHRPQPKKGISPKRPTPKQPLPDAPIAGAVADRPVEKRPTRGIRPDRPQVIAGLMVDDEDKKK